MPNSPVHPHARAPCSEFVPLLINISWLALMLIGSIDHKLELLPGHHCFLPCWVDFSSSGHKHDSPRSLFAKALMDRTKARETVQKTTDRGRHNMKNLYSPHCWKIQILLGEEYRFFLWKKNPNSWMLQ